MNPVRRLVRSLGAAGAVANARGACREAEARDRRMAELAQDWSARRDQPERRPRSA